MVFLKRTRHLNLMRLSEQPVENLTTVHTILLHSVHEILDKLKKASQAFYGTKNRDYVEEIQKWAAYVKAVVVGAHLPALVSSEQLEEIARNAGDPHKKFKFDMFQMNKTKELVRKVLDFVPYKLKDITDDLNSILGYLDKYCLSFYETESGIDFATAKEYETKRTEWRETISQCLQTIKELPAKFKKDGLDLSHFSQFGKELGLKAGTYQCMFLVLFEEVSENIRVACQSVKQWVQADQNYALYISYDLTDLEGRKSSVLKTMRDLQQRYASLCFGLKNLEERCEQLHAELAKLREKEEELTVEEELLLEESNEIQLEIDRKEWRRGELLKNHSSMNREVFQEKFNEVTEVLRDMKSKLPFVSRQLQAVHHKLSWISIKRDEVVDEQKKKDLIQQQIDEIEQDRLEREIEYESLVKVLDLAKHIYKCKSTPDSVSKIYYGQAVEINNSRLPGNKGHDDPFEISCTVVCKQIGHDWPRLYRALPFSPTRGENTIDADIAEMTMLEQRQGPMEVATKALHRWRRFHTRAKQEDLIKALKTIRRKDIVLNIERKLDPSKFVVPDIFADIEDEEKDPLVEDYLIPCLREIERYDRLKAAGRIA